MTSDEKLLELAWAVERITVEVQELASASLTTIGSGQAMPVIQKLGSVNRRLMEVFPDLTEMPR
jgi:hypothetical protein